MANKQTIGQMLLAAKMIDEIQMEIALAEHERTGKRIGSTLIDLNFVDENVLAAFLSKQVDIPCISLLHVDIPRKVLRRIPSRLARQCLAIPIRVEGTTIEVAMVDPTDTATVELLETATSLKVRPLIAPESSVQKMLDKLYAEPKIDTEDTLAGEVRVTRSSDPSLSDLVDDLESGDFTGRLDRLEERLDQVWTLLEKILRILESRKAVVDRVVATREWAAEDE